MIKRPKPSDDEGEILRQQEEFLKNKSEKPAATVVNKRHQQPVAENPENIAKKPKSKFAIERERLAATKHFPTSSQLLGEIRERNVSGDIAPPKLGNEKGFPSAFSRDKSLKQTDGSIFSNQLGMKKKEPSNASVAPQPVNTQIFGDRSYVVSGPEATEIHLANAQRLAAMTAEDIVKERDALVTQLDPSVLSFLRSRRHKKELEAESKEMEVDVSSQEQPLSGPTPSTSKLPEVAPPPEAMETEQRDEWTLEDPGRFPHMDVVEEDKLVWTTPLPAGSTPADSVSARFDFNGFLLAADDESPVTRGLHHHGDEPARAGYTVQELLILGRSSMPQQRITALTTLGNVLAKTKLGYFDECFEPALLQQLLERELFLFVRFALDDTNLSVVCAAVFALRHLFCDSADEVLLSRCDSSVLDLRPSLAVPTELTERDAAELKDHELLSLDVVRGALRTGLLDRLDYVLSSLHPPPATVTAALDVLIRVGRHSAESCRALAASGVLDSAFRSVSTAPDQATVPSAVRALRLLRLVCRCRLSAGELTERLPVMTKVAAFLQAAMDGGDSAVWLPLVLESLYLWRRLLDLGLATEHVSSLWPLTMSLWRRVAQLTDLSAGAGDLEVACAVIAWLRSACAAGAGDAAVCHGDLVDCLHKWMAQVVGVEPTFPMIKLLGIAFSCAAVFSSNVPQQEEASDARRAETERRLAPLLKEGGTFEKHLIKNLFPCSNLTHRGAGSRRHPSSLPSLGGVLPGGQLVPAMRPDCPLMLLLGLADYLLAARQEHKQSTRLLLDSSAMLSAVEAVVSCQPALTSNCFTRLETRLFARLALIACGSRSESDATQSPGLYHRLAIKLTWLLSKSDRPLLSMLLRDVIFNPSLFPDCGPVLEPISRLYDSALGLDSAPQESAPDDGSEPALPADWCFLPLMADAASAESQGLLDRTRDCLAWVAICEARGLTGGVDVTARFCRVVTVFLAGPDVFLDSVVRTHLESILGHLMLSEQMLDFNANIPGLTSFYDLYTQLLEQFVACSYGDPTFCRYLLVPLAQRHSASFRRQAWGEHGAALRVLRLPLAQLPVPALSLQEPVENEPALLDVYLAALARGAVRKEWSPVPHAVALHHLAMFLASDQQEPRLVGYQSSLRERVAALGNQELRDSLLNYSGFPDD